jgi:hypothetical protein
MGEVIATTMLGMRDLKPMGIHLCEGLGGLQAGVQESQLWYDW